MTDSWKHLSNVPVQRVFSVKSSLESKGKEVRTGDAYDKEGRNIPGFIGIEVRDSVKKIIDKAQIRSAWETPADYPFAKYQKLELLEDIESIEKPIYPRFIDADQKCVRELVNLYVHLDAETAVILDSGGSHSVAMAYQIAKDKGMQPVIMFPNSTFQGTGSQTYQQLGVMLHFQKEMEELQPTLGRNIQRNPVFVLDCHRNDGEKVNDPHFNFHSTDFPTAEELKAQGIKRVIYVNEADKKGLTLDRMERKAGDLGPIMEEWMKNGIQIEKTGISPVQRQEAKNRKRVSAKKNKKPSS